MPLQKAVMENRVDVVQFLIENVMRPDPEKDSGLLMFAIENNFIPMLKLLLPFFDLNLELEDGQTPLFSVQSKEAAECLIKEGAKPDISDFNEKFPYQTVGDPEAAEYLKDSHPSRKNQTA